MILYIQLYMEFFKIGLFAMGGGLATLPFLYRLAATTGWFSALELTNMLAISEVTPGPLGINMASFAGYNTGGVLGSFIATAGLITPALVAIILVARFLDKAKDNKFFQAAFGGIRPAVCGMLAVAVWMLLKVCLFNSTLYTQTGDSWGSIPLKSLMFFIALFTFGYKYKIHPFAFIAISAVAGLLIKF